MDNSNDYHVKYLKYKTKYLQLREAISMEDTNLEQEGGFLTKSMSKLIFFDSQDLINYDIFKLKSGKITNLQDIKNNIGDLPNPNIDVNKRDLYKQIHGKAYSGVVKSKKVKLVELTFETVKRAFKSDSQVGESTPTLVLDKNTQVLYEKYKQLNQPQKAYFINRLFDNILANNQTSIIKKIDTNTSSTILHNLPLAPNKTDLSQEAMGAVQIAVMPFYNRLPDDSKAKFLNYVLSEISADPTVNKELIDNFDVNKFYHLFTQAGGVRLPKQINLSKPIAIGSPRDALDEINKQIYKYSKQLNTILILRESRLGKDKVLNLYTY